MQEMILPLVVLDVYEEAAGYGNVLVEHDDGDNTQVVHPWGQQRQGRPGWWSSHSQFAGTIRGGECPFTGDSPGFRNLDPGDSWLLPTSPSLDAGAGLNPDVPPEYRVTGNTCRTSRRTHVCSLVCLISGRSSLESRPRYG